MNNKVKVHIDTISYKDKETAKLEYGFIKPRLQNESTIQEIELSELMKKIKQGFTISPAIMNGTKSKDWLEQQLFMVDVDNKPDTFILTLNDVLKIYKECELNPIFYYYTFNSTTEIPRFRIVFLMDKIITNIDIRNKVQTILYDLIEKSDKQCLNAQTMFLGTNKEVVSLDLNNRITLNNVFSVGKLETIENKSYNKSKEYNKYKELEQLKMEFPLLDLMIEENGEYKEFNRYIMFENCNICGHNNCLVYYKESNTFCCFGATENKYGIKYGSIIDYLIVTRNLTLKEAIKELYNLSGIELSNLEVKPLNSITAEELQNEEIPELVYYVENLIAPGLTMISGTPKVGKSYFAFGMCIAVSLGEKFLNFNTTQCGCLYLALEDGKGRLQRRMNELLKGNQPPKNLHLVIESNDIKNGLFKQLEYEMEKFPDIKVIVIDIFQRVRGESKGNNIYANDYNDAGSIQKFAQAHDIAIILIHHANKGKFYSDTYERVSGTNGLTGALDTNIVLEKSDNELYSLNVKGRDVNEKEYVLTRDETGSYKMKAKKEDYEKSLMIKDYNNNTIIQIIKTLLENNNGYWEGTVSKLNEEYKKQHGELYVEKESVSILGNELKKLKPLLLKYDNIEYTPPSTPRNGIRPITLKKIKKEV